MWYALKIEVAVISPCKTFTLYLWIQNTFSCIQELPVFSIGFRIGGGRIGGVKAVPDCLNMWGSLADLCAMWNFDTWKIFGNLCSYSCPRGISASVCVELPLEPPKSLLLA